MSNKSKGQRNRNRRPIVNQQKPPSASESIKRIADAFKQKQPAAMPYKEQPEAVSVVMPKTQNLSDSIIVWEWPTKIGKVVAKYYRQDHNPGGEMIAHAGDYVVDIDLHETMNLPTNEVIGLTIALQAATVWKETWPQCAGNFFTAEPKPKVKIVNEEDEHPDDCAQCDPDPDNEFGNNQGDNETKPGDV
jgi:hypothetical protein